MATTLDMFAPAMTAPPAGISEDAALVRAAQAGNRAAFGWLYGRYARMVHGILLARVPRPEVEPPLGGVPRPSLPVHDALARRPIPRDIMTL